MTTPVGSLEPGRRFTFSSGKEYEVVGHDSMGTQIRGVARVAKQVFDKKSGKTVRFSSAAKLEQISSAAEVTPV